MFQMKLQKNYKKEIQILLSVLINQHTEKFKKKLIKIKKLVSWNKNLMVSKQLFNVKKQSVNVD